MQPLQIIKNAIKIIVNQSDKHTSNLSDLPTASSKGASKRSSKPFRYRLCLLLAIIALATESYALEFDDPERTYETVVSPVTGRIWLGRNLGATQTATATDDSDSFGDLYQWGRAADGHQIRTSGTTTTLTTSITSTSTLFVLHSSGDWTEADESGADRVAAWADGGVNDICPAGFSVPTDTE